MRSPIVRVFCVAALAFVVVQGVRYYPKLPARTKAGWSMLREDYKSAINHWNQQLQENPNDRDAVLRLAECFDKLGDQQTAGMIYHTVQDYINSSELDFGQRYHRDRFQALRLQGF